MSPQSTIEGASAEYKLPNMYWLRFVNVPDGTEVDIRKMDENDIILDETVGPIAKYKGPKVSIVGSSDVSGIKTKYFPDGWNYQVMLPHFNQIKMPNGTVVNFPWSSPPFLWQNGVELDEIEPKHLQFGQLSFLPRYQKLSLQDWNRIAVGDIVKIQQIIYMVSSVPTAQEGLFRLFQIDYRTVNGIQNIIKNSFKFQEDFQSYGMNVPYAEGWQLIGKYTFQQMQSIGTPVRQETLKVGDVLILRAGGNSTGKALVRHVGAGRDGKRKIFITVNYEELDDVEWLQKTGINNISDWSGYQMYLVEHVDVPLPEVHDFDGFRINDDGIDVIDAALFKASFTQEIVDAFKIAGITEMKMFPFSLDDGLGRSSAEAREGRTVSLPEGKIINSFSNRGIGDQTSAVSAVLKGPIKSIRVRTQGLFDRLDVWWPCAPNNQNVASPYVSIVDDNSGMIATYHPIERCVQLGIIPVMLSDTYADELRTYLSDVSKVVKATAEEYARGELHQAVEQYMARGAMYKVFKTIELPNDVLIMNGVGYKIVPASKNEQSDITFVGERLRYKVGDQIPLNTELIKAANILCAKRDIVSEKMNEFVNQLIDAKTAEMTVRVVEPTTDHISSVSSTAMEKIIQSKSMVDALIASIKLDQSEMKKKMMTYSKSIDLVRGLVQATLPNGMWYTRFSEDGTYIEACLDKVTWSDVTKRDFRVTTPILLRVRIYNDEGAWKIVTYSENLDFIADKSAITLHPHITISDVKIQDKPLTSTTVSFCFGAAGPTIKYPNHSDAVTFLKMLKEYLQSIQRVLVSVCSAEGYGRDKLYTGMYLVGMGLSESEDEWEKLVRSFGLAVESTNEIIKERKIAHEKVMTNFMKMIQPQQAETEVTPIVRAA